MIDCWGIFCEIILRWLSLDLADEKSTLVQVMTWCRQATSHYPGLPTSKICFPYFVEKISVFLITFPYPLICSSSDSKQSLWQLPIYSGGTHWLPVETLEDYFGTTGIGSEEEHVLLPHVEERRMNVLVIKDVFEGFKA